MATEVIGVNLTSTYFVDSNDTVVLAAGASLITTSQFSLTTRTTLDANITVVINGVIENNGLADPDPFVTGAAIFLDSRPAGGADANNVVRIGATGHINSENGLAVLAIGSNTTVLNDGQIEGLGGIQVSGLDNFVRNSGTIEFGAQAIGSQGQGYPGTAFNTIQNTGTMIYSADLDIPNSNSIAIIASGDYTRVLNAGLIVCQNGMLLNGGYSSFTNTGTVDATGSAVAVNQASNFRLSNSGALQSSDEGATAVQMNGNVSSVLTNSGTISAEGTAIGGTATRINNTGDIIGGISGITQECQSDFTLINSDTIVGGVTGVTINIFTGGDEIATVVNSGTIRGGLDPLSPTEALRIEGGTARVNNAGQLIGDVYMNGLYNGLINSGTIVGDVFGGYGPLVYRGVGAGVVQGDINGSWENDRLFGGAVADRLFGSEGNDILSGGGGNDVLNGGFARDVLSGGTGADMFIFSTAEDITTSYFGSDRITDFQTGIDHIDLSAFMSGGAFIGASRFHGVAGEVRYNAVTGNLVGDVNGDRVFDWSMAFTNKAALTAADFIF